MDENGNAMLRPEAERNTFSEVVLNPNKVGTYKLKMCCGSYSYGYFKAKLVYADYCGEDGEFEGQHIYDVYGNCTRCEVKKKLDSNKFVNGIKYQLDEENKTATVIYDESYQNAAEGWYVSIPDEVINGNTKYTVSAISDGAFLNCTKLGRIILPDYIETIGKEAFKNCENLNKVVLPKHLKTIGEEAFYGCAGVSEIVLSDEITAMGKRAFAGSGITKISIPSKVSVLEEGLFQSCAKLEKINMADRFMWNASLTTVEKNVVANCSKLESFDITASMIADNIDAEAFNYYTGNIAVPCTYPFGKSVPKYMNSTNDGLTFSWRDHFKRTDNMCIVCQESPDELDKYDRDWQGVKYILSTEGEENTAVVAPSTEHATFNCSYASKDWHLLIPAEVVKSGVTYKVIGLSDEAFKNIDKLKTITFAEGIKEIGNSAFSGCVLEDAISIPNSVSTIKDSAFAGFKGVINLPCRYYSNSDTFKENALSGTVFNKAEHIMTANGVCSVCQQENFLDDNFYDEHGIKYTLSTLSGNGTATVSKGHNVPGDEWDVVIPSKIYKMVSEVVYEYTVVGIEDDAFKDCTKLRSISLPEGITSIGESAFEGCTNLLNFVIPKNITEIKDRTFYNCILFTTITIPSKVTSIGGNVFGNCDRMSYIVIPVTVTAIDDNSFNDYKGHVYLSCRDYANSDAFKLNSPEETIFTKEAHSVTNGVCSECHEEIILDENNRDAQGVHYVLSSDGEGNNTAIVGTNHLAPLGDWDVIILNSVYKKIDGNFIEYKVTGVGNDSFKNRTNLKKIKLPEGMNAIGDNAFYGCSSLPSITIPGNVSSIGAGAFYNCSLINVLQLPDGVTVIESNLIGNCDSLNEITISVNVTTIRDDAFVGYEGTVNLPCRTYENYETFRDNAEDATFTKKLHTLNEEGKCSVCHEQPKEAYVDKNNRDMQGVHYILSEDGTARVGTKHSAPVNNWSITIPDTIYVMTAETVVSYTVVGINENAFKNYKCLTGITLPDTITEIQGYCFAGCDNLPEIYLSDNVAGIADEAFALYKGVVSYSCKIYENAAAFIENAPEATFKQRNHTMNTDGKCSICGIDAVLDENDRDWQGIHYSFGTINDDPTVIAYVSGAVETWNEADQSTRYITPHIIPEEGDWNVVIPSKIYRNQSGRVTEYDVVLLDTDAFYGFPIRISQLKSVTVSEGIKYIGFGAFSFSGIETITLPSTVETIGNYAFACCRQLKSIELPEAVTSIGIYAFDECDSLTSIVIPQNVTTLKRGVFARCKNLTDITLSEGITTLGESLFSGSNKIEHIYIPNSVTTISDKLFESLDGLAAYKGTVSLSCRNYSNIETIKEYAPEAVFTVRNHIQSTKDNSCIVCGISLNIDADNRDYQGVQYIFTTDDNGNHIAIVGTNHSPAEDHWRVIIPKVIYREEEGTTIAYTVTGISENAFSNQDKLESLYISETIKTLGDNLAKDCSNLTSLTLSCGSKFGITDEEFWNSKGVSLDILIKNDHVDEDRDYVCDNCESELFEDGFWIKDIPDYTYTGKAIKPQLQVYYYNRLLTINKDYTVKYSKNTNVGEAKIVITGKKNFTLSETVYFNIVKEDIGNANFATSDIYLKDNGKGQKPKPTIKWNGKTLSSKVYTYSYYKLDAAGKVTGDALLSVSEPGQYVIFVQAKENGNFTGTRRINVTMASRDEVLVKNLRITSIKPQQYTGAAICPAVVVKEGKKELSLSENGTDGDYIVEYKNNISVGTATVVVTGIGKYKGTKTATFKITGKPLSKASVRGLPSTVIYTGNEITFDSLEMYIKQTKTTPEIPLYENTDYKVSYSKNVNTGKATVIFTGINGYTGVVKKNFTIKPFVYTDDISRFDIKLVADNLVNVNDVYYNSIEYAKGGAKPKVLITFRNADGSLGELKEKTDFSVSYKRNTSVNDGSNLDKIPYVAITFRGKYKGSTKVNFVITKKDISKVNASAGDVVFKQKNKNYTTGIRLTDLDGKTLSNKADYLANVEYSVIRDGEKVILTANDMVNAGETVTAKVSAKENGNYFGTKEVTYRVTKASVSSAKYSVEKQIYTGNEITLEGNEITLKFKSNSPALVYGEDFVIVDGSYKNNVNAGTATVVIKGINNYGGTKTIKFSIRAKKFEWWWRLFQ